MDKCLVKFQTKFREDPTVNQGWAVFLPRQLHVAFSRSFIKRLSPEASSWLLWEARSLSIHTPLLTKFTSLKIITDENNATKNQTSNIISNNIYIYIYIYISGCYKICFPHSLNPPETPIPTQTQTRGGISRKESPRNSPWYQCFMLTYYCSLLASAPDRASSIKR